MKFMGMQRSEQIHIAVRAIHRFKDHEGRFPRDDQEDADKIKILAKKINEDGKKAEALCVEELDEEVIRQIAAYSACSITSQSAFFGGIVAQEIVKYTGKYTPLKQMMHYDVLESLPTGQVNRAPRGCRYDD